MQPRQASRGTTVVAAGSLVLGIVLTVSIFVLSACGGSSPSVASTAPVGSSASSSSPAPTTSAPPATTAPATTAPATTAPGTTTPAEPVTRPPVPIAAAATVGPGVTATVITIEPVTATAALPGEIAGPAVRLTLAFQNSGSSPIDLGNVTVDLQDASASSATPLSGNGSAPFSGTAAPGASATGVYVFSLPAADRVGVSLYVTSNADLPVVVFTGDVS